MTEALNNLSPVATLAELLLLARQLVGRRVIAFDSNVHYAPIVVAGEFHLGRPNEPADDHDEDPVIAVVTPSGGVWSWALDADEFSGGEFHRTETALTWRMDNGDERLLAPLDAALTDRGRA